MVSKLLTGIMLIGTMCFSTTSLACTIFAAHGTAVEDGGLIIVKNRDAEPSPQSVQKVKTFKYDYYGLYGYTRKGAPLLLGGVNEQGLVVIHSKASCIDDAYQDVPGKSVVNEYLLKNCSTVEECLQSTKALNSPCFLLIGDSKEIATVEIGPKKELHIQRTSNSTISHTNHYRDPNLKKYDVKLGTSTVKRQKKIDQLLQTSTKPLSLNDMIAFSEDKSEGVNNSIWREGVSFDATQTLGRFLVHLHPDKTFEVKAYYRPSERKVYKYIDTNSTNLFRK